MDLQNLCVHFSMIHHFLLQPRTPLNLVQFLLNHNYHFLIFSQKIDSTNIPTNVLTNLQSSYLLRTSSQFNINNTIGLNEEVEEITRIRVQDFPKGRVIFKDGLSSEKVLLQTPYLAQDVQNSMIKYFKSWINK